MHISGPKSPVYLKNKRKILLLQTVRAGQGSLKDGDKIDQIYKWLLSLLQKKLFRRASGKFLFLIAALQKNDITLFMIIHKIQWLFTYNIGNTKLVREK